MMYGLVFHSCENNFCIRIYTIKMSLIPQSQHWPFESWFHEWRRGYVALCLVSFTPSTLKRGGSSILGLSMDVGIKSNIVNIIFY